MGTAPLGKVSNFNDDCCNYLVDIVFYLFKNVCVCLFLYLRSLRNLGTHYEDLGVCEKMQSCPIYLKIINHIYTFCKERV